MPDRLKTLRAPRIRGLEGNSNVEGMNSAQRSIRCCAGIQLSKAIIHGVLGNFDKPITTKLEINIQSSEHQIF